jgi:hypothetical protein
MKKIDYSGYGDYTPTEPEDRPKSDFPKQLLSCDGIFEGETKKVEVGEWPSGGIWVRLAVHIPEEEKMVSSNRLTVEGLSKDGKFNYAEVGYQILKSHGIPTAGSEKWKNVDAEKLYAQLEGMKCFPSITAKAVTDTEKPFACSEVTFFRTEDQFEEKQNDNTHQWPYKDKGVAKIVDGK